MIELRNPNRWGLLDVLSNDIISWSDFLGDVYAGIREMEVYFYGETKRFLVKI